MFDNVPIDELVYEDLPQRIIDLVIDKQKQKSNKKRKEWVKNLSEEKRKEMYRKKTRCEACKIDIFNSNLSRHKKCKKHIVNEMKMNGTYVEKDKKTWYQNKTREEKKEFNSRKYVCKYCNVEINLSNKFNHNKSKKHLKNIENSD